MKSLNEENRFYRQLEERLKENKKLYSSSTGAGKLAGDSWMSFIASYLGVSPWKVILPTTFLFSLFLRLFWGREYSEAVLKLLGGR